MMGMEYRILMKESLYGAVQGVLNGHATKDLNISSWDNRKILIVPTTSYFFKRL